MKNLENFLQKIRMTKMGKFRNGNRKRNGNDNNSSRNWSNYNTNGSTYSGFKSNKTQRKQFGRPDGETFLVSGGRDFPKVFLSKKAHDKMWCLIQNCPIEISWMSSVTRDEDGDFIIHDVYVPLQECGAASTDISADGDADLLNALIAEDKIDEIARLKCWGHSHVRMGVTPSGTDETQTTDFIDRIQGDFVRLIGNKYGELQCDVYLFNEKINLHNPTISILSGDDNDYNEWAKEQINSKVTERVYTYSSGWSKGSKPSYSNNSYGGYGGYYSGSHYDDFYGQNSDEEDGYNWERDGYNSDDYQDVRFLTAPWDAVDKAREEYEEVPELETLLLDNAVNEHYNDYEEFSDDEENYKSEEE